MTVIILIIYSLFLCLPGSHLWLLSSSVDLASNLCLPLAGPDVFTEEESATLPDLLVYQPDDKRREPDASIRRMIVEALIQVLWSCITLTHYPYFVFSKKVFEGLFYIVTILY